MPIWSSADCDPRPATSTSYALEMAAIPPSPRSSRARHMSTSTCCPRTRSTPPTATRSARSTMDSDTTGSPRSRPMSSPSSCGRGARCSQSGSWPGSEERKRSHNLRIGVSPGCAYMASGRNRTARTGPGSSAIRRTGEFFSPLHSCGGAAERLNASGWSPERQARALQEVLRRLRPGKGALQGRGLLE